MNKQNENIVYKNYTSTSIERKYHEDSNRPDSLISIMRDHIVIWRDESNKDEDRSK